MLNVLSEEYLPEEVVHREKQLDKLRGIFDIFKKWEMGNNLVIFGSSGSGKTTIIRKVIEEKDNSLYTSCNQHNTAVRAFKSLFNLKYKDQSDVITAAFESLTKDPKVLVFDEVDKIKDFENFMNMVNAVYRKTMIPIILITVRRVIISEMPEDARKTLFFERLSLPAYTADELKDIILHRVDLMKKLMGEKFKGLEDGIVNMIAAASAKQGSARMALSCLIRCFQNDNFSEEYIYKIHDELVMEEWASFINEITGTEKEVLTEVLNLCDHKNEVSFGKVKEATRLSSSRVTQILNLLERYGAIISRLENHGRAGGRKRFVRFSDKGVYDKIKIKLGKND